MAKFLIEIEDYELDFITDLINGSISEFERIKLLNDAIGKKTKQQFVDNIEAQKKLFNELTNETNQIQKWNYFSENSYPLNDCDIVVFSNKKQKYYIEFTDSEFAQRCINRNYIKWTKL